MLTIIIGNPLYLEKIMDKTLSPEARSQQLLRLPLFSDLTKDVLLELSSIVKELSYKRNTVIISQGDDTRSLYIVLHGRLKVLASDEDGNQTIFSFLGAGDFFW